MKKTILFTLLMLAAALPGFAVERHQSYISYDDGGTVIRSGEDDREVEAQRNLPVFPGDEVVTARRGRAEIRLSDGNIIGIDRASALRFDSILDSYEGDGDETVAQLRYGKVAIFRTDLGRDHVRLDTDNASYVAEDQAIYSVESDARGRDRVAVFEGSVEVRTPERTTRLRRGEVANIDDRGIYDLVDDQSYGADDFDRWFLERSERFQQSDSRYVDRDLGYWVGDLAEYGGWVTIGGYGNVWRPTVSVGWRPYTNGYWHRNRWGTLTWVSYDPWGFGTYHYGRWSYDPFYGWFWVPGYGYSPAWVYWMWGSGYVGWAPSGWWDCYRPYYDWAYQPYSRWGNGFGFYGRVRVNEMDLRPWTFVDSVGLVSRRVDRAALTADAIKHRLGREGGYAAVNGGPARFTNEEFKDPAEAIRRRALDGQGGRSITGRETGAPPTDLTPFFRRDNQISGTIRDRIRSGATPSTGRVAAGGGSVAPIGTGSVAPIGRGGVAPIGGSNTGGSAVDRRGNGGAVAPGRIDRGSGISRGGAGSGTTASEPDSAGTVRRGTIGGGSGRGTGTGSSTGTVGRGTGSTSGSTGGTASGSSGTANSGSRSVWRGRDSSRSGTVVLPPSTSTPSTAPGAPADSPGDSWRGRDRSTGTSTRSYGSSDDSARRGDSYRGSSDVPRRVIDRIGGARIVPRESGSSSSGSSSSGTTRSWGGSTGSSSGSSGRSYGGGSSSSRSGGSSSGASSRSSSGSSSRSSGSSTSSSSGSSRSSGGSRGSGGGTVSRHH